MRMKKFITKKEIAKAERLLNKLDKIKFGVKLSLNVEAQLIAEYNAKGEETEAEYRRGKLRGMLSMAEKLGVITFEEKNILTKYFIDKYVSMTSEIKHSAA